MSVLTPSQYRPYGDVAPYGTRDRDARKAADAAAKNAGKKNKGKRTVGGPATACAGSTPRTSRDLRALWPCTTTWSDHSSPTDERA